MPPPTPVWAIGYTRVVNKRLSFAFRSRRQTAVSSAVVGFKPRPPLQPSDHGPVARISAMLAEAVARLWGDAEPIRVPNAPNVPMLAAIGLDMPAEWRKPADVYPHGADLVAGLVARELAAVWYALRAVPTRDPEAAAQPALAMTALGTGEMLQKACHVALAPSATGAAFDALFAANAYGASVWPHAVAAARARLDANPAAQFEPHRAPTVSVWDSWTPEVRATWTKRLADSSARFRRADSYAAVSALEYLGRHDWAAARARIDSFRDHPAHDVRLSLGHALLRLGSCAAFEMLLERLHSCDHLERFFAVKAALRLDPVDAWSRLGGAELTDGHAEVVCEAFQVLANDHKDRRFDRYPAFGWLQLDERWHDLAVVWSRKTGGARDTAKWILSYLTKEQHSAAKKRVKRAAKPAPIAVEPEAIPDQATLERWATEGTFWINAQALGEAIRHPDVYDAAYPIALRSMRAIRTELEQIVARLRELGYRFVAPVPLPAPADNVRAQLTRLESLGGVLPMSVRAACEIIGPVHLAGWHPSWPVAAHTDAGASANVEFWATDPLSLTPLDDLIEYAEDNASPDTTYRLAIAADDYGKAGFSGGHHSFEMPCPFADTRLDGAAGSPMFIAYLRESLRWGGLPGFARIDARPTEFLRAVVG